MKTTKERRSKKMKEVTPPASCENILKAVIPMK